MEEEIVSVLLDHKIISTNGKEPLPPLSTDELIKNNHWEKIYSFQPIHWSPPLVKID